MFDNLILLTCLLLIVVVICMTAAKTFGVRVDRRIYLSSIAALILCYILGCFITWTNSDAFPKIAHDEMRTIYKKNKNELLLGKSSHLVSLGKQCHPPIGCECWIAIDLDGSEGMKDENLSGAWHESMAKLINPPPNEPSDRVHSPLSYYLGAVSIMKIGQGVYSLMACEL